MKAVETTLNNRATGRTAAWNSRATGRKTAWSNRATGRKTAWNNRATGRKTGEWWGDCRIKGSVMERPAQTLKHKDGWVYC